MWKIAVFLLFATIFVSLNAKLPDNYIRNLVEENFRSLCDRNSNSQNLPRVMSAFIDMEKCAQEENLMKIVRDTFIATKSRHEWDNLYTNLCAKLSAKKKCAEDFNGVAKECMSNYEFMQTAAVANSTIDFWSVVCRKEKGRVVDFIMNNSVECMVESTASILQCIQRGRLTKDNIVTKEEVETLSENCFILDPCNPARIDYLRLKHSIFTE